MMNEAAADNADALPTPCDAAACDLIIRPSPSPPPSLCKQKDECSNDNKKLEQQVNRAEAPRANGVSDKPLLELCLPINPVNDSFRPLRQQPCNQAQPKKKVKVC